MPAAARVQRDRWYDSTTGHVAVKSVREIASIRDATAPLAQAKGSRSRWTQRGPGHPRASRSDAGVSER